MSKMEELKEIKLEGEVNKIKFEDLYKLKKRNEFLEEKIKEPYKEEKEGLTLIIKALIELEHKEDNIFNFFNAYFTREDISFQLENYGQVTTLGKGRRIIKMKLDGRTK